MRKILLVAAAVLAALAMTAVSASAAYRQRGSFAGNGSGLGGQGSADGQLRSPGAADVRTSTGEVYVADTGNNRVQAFSPTATGATYDAQVAITAPTGLAVDQATGDVYVSNASGVRKFDEDLNPVASGWTAPTDTGTLAVDPGSHDLVLADQGDNLIRRYSSDGTPGATFPAARPLDVAVDSTGDVIVVTSTGDIINVCSATSAVERFSSAGVSEGTIGSLSTPLTVAVDPDDDEVVVGAQVNQYNPLCDVNLLPMVALFASDGTPGPTFTFELSSLAQWDIMPGLAAVGGGSSRIYSVITSPAGDEFGYTKVAVLEDLIPPQTSIDPVDAASVTATAATFTGTVDPNGQAAQFHYDYRIAGTADWTSTSDRNAGSGTAPLPTGSVVVTGLRPNTDYEVRLAARSIDGEGVSASRAFSTDAVPPTVDTRLALGITATGARLNGRVDPNGLPTTYWVEYGPTTAYGSRSGADADAGTGYGDVSVGQTVTGLQAQTTYHFRIVANNAEGTTPGADNTFQTSAIPKVTDVCPNAGIRAQQGGGLLPDCRAYEMISPPDKNGSDVLIHNGTIRSATDGRTAAFSSTGAFAGSPGSPASVQYLATRGDSGWRTDGISPPQPPNRDFGAVSTSYRGYTDDLRTGFVSVYPGPPLVASAPQGVPNLYARKLPTGSYSLLSALAPGVPAPTPTPYAPSRFASASADGSHVLFESTNNLTPDAAGLTTKLYESVDGEIRLAGILPADEGGGPAPNGSAAGVGTSTNSLTDRTISRDGSRVFFTANPHSDQWGQIYFRENGVTKALVSAPEAGAPPGADKPARFWTATPDGRYVVFASAQKLTADSTADPTASLVRPHGKPDLYRYDVQSGDLVDVSVSQTGAPADIGAGSALDIAGGGVVGTSDDGSQVYFVGLGQIVPGAPVSARPMKLYRWQQGQGVTYIASLSVGEGGVWTQAVGSIPTKQSRVATDGRRLLFVTRDKLDADRDNGGHLAAYLYSADSNSIDCVSCPGDGSPATADATMGSAAGVAGTLAPTAAEGFAHTGYLPRYLSDDGRRAFFMSAGSLAAGDSNGKEDVYMWQDGEVSLISTGKSGDRSFFGDASPSGDDVFFATRERLLAQDTDNNLDIYDARVSGGLPEPTPPAKQCVGDACQGASTAPTVLPDAGSVTFSGPADSSGSALVPGQPATKVTVSKVKAVVGTATTLTVKVPSAGSIQLSGAAVRTAKKSTSKAATYRIIATLSPKAKATLKRKKTLKVKVKVAFTPESGRTASKTVTLTFKQPKSPVRKHRRGSAQGSVASSGVRS